MSPEGRAQVDTAGEIWAGVVTAPVPMGWLGKAGLWLKRAFGGGSRWTYGTGKSATKWANQMQKRGWTESQVSEALSTGQKFQAENLVNKGNSATRYVHPETGRSVVIDDTTREIIHVGGDGFKY